MLKVLGGLGIITGEFPPANPAAGTTYATDGNANYPDGSVFKYAYVNNGTNPAGMYWVDITGAVVTNLGEAPIIPPANNNALFDGSDQLFDGSEELTDTGT